MAGKTVHAAGGIVVRNGSRPLIAVVQRAKDELWVLPRGKLKSNESALRGARREVVEETGHRVQPGRDGGHNGGGVAPARRSRTTAELSA